MNYFGEYFYIISLLIIFMSSTVHSLLHLFNTNTSFILRIFSLIVIVSCLSILTNRNIYLPFLGKTVIPPSLFENEKVPAYATEKYTLELKDVVDGTRVIYWGSLPNTNKHLIHKNPFEAYGNYSNTGIAIVKNQKATIHFHCPTKYNVSMYNKTINRHIHYRLVYKNDAMIGPILTQYVNC